MKVIMIDQDGVIFDAGYQATLSTDAFLDFRRISNNLLIIPNSDTPITRLDRNFRKVFDFVPSGAIGERGAVIRWKKSRHYLATVDGLPEYRQKIAEHFQISDKECLVIIGDTAAWLKKKRRFKPYRRLLLLDDIRECSLNFYLLVSNKEGLPTINREWFENGLAIMRQVKRHRDLSNENFNPEYGIAIMNAMGVCKTNGYLALRQILEQTQRKLYFFMIGDSDSDIIQDNQVCHLAVGNASATLKQKSAFTADKPYTKGLLQCLRWINEL